MKKALIIGGTRFFGIHLVKELIESNWDVTVATRGAKEDSFGNRVKRVKIDRNDKEMMKKAFENESFDVIYDQICYASFDALEAIDVFRNKTKKYIVTSSMSAYGKKRGELSENDFDPVHYPLIVKRAEEVPYDEGKRLMEAAFFQKAPFPVTAVRFPIVLGENDYTDRLLFYIKKIANNEPVYFKNTSAKISFIKEEEAGAFLAWLSESDLEGPVNASSQKPVALKSLLNTIEKVTGHSALVKEPEEGSQEESPYAISESWILDTQKAQQAGFSFLNTTDYLSNLVSTLYKKFE